MDEQKEPVGSPSRAHPSPEEPMLREDVVRELLARLERGEGVKRVARELGVDRKTVKRWRQVGQWRRQVRRRTRQIDSFIPFIEQRGPEVDWNCAVLHRELRALGYPAGVLQVQRYVQPRRAARRWAAVATVRYETAPGQQGQVDFGQLSLWIGERPETAHLFVFTLGRLRGAGLSP
jgi:transposase